MSQHDGVGQKKMAGVFNKHDRLVRLRTLRGSNLNTKGPSHTKTKYGGGVVEELFQNLAVIWPSVLLSLRIQDANVRIIRNPVTEMSS